MTDGLVLINPTIDQLLGLLGAVVYCKSEWPEADEAHSITGRVVGAVVPAPGSKVSAQLLLDDGLSPVHCEGFNIEVFLDTLVYLRVVTAA